MLTKGRDREFEKEVVREFAFISQVSAPKVVRSDYDEQHFGNAVVELEGDHLKVRVTRDRGQTLVDLAPIHRNSWFIVEVVLQTVGAPIKTFDESLEASVEHAAQAISKHWPAIVHRFSEPNWKATEVELENRLDRRGRELEARLFGTRRAH